MILSDRELKRRTWISFSVFLLMVLLMVGTWVWLNRQPEIDETPKPFRQVFELNGKLWKSLSRTSRLNRSEPPPKGKLPRVNGKIGLEGPFNVEQWSLEAITNDQDPKSRHFTVTMKDIRALPRTETNLQFRCVEGWSEEMSFAGVKFSDFMKAYHLESHPYVGLQTTDGEYYVSVDIESMMHEQTLLAYEMNGLPLRIENGAPLRLVIPVKYGIKNLKRIGKIFFSDQRPPDYWAERGYDWHASL